jgi:hypothetical protein
MTTHGLEYILQKQQELEDATSRIAEVRARAARDEASKAQNQIPYDDAAQSLDIMVLQATAKLDEMKECGKDRWDDLKEEVESTLTRLKNDIGNLVNQNS